MQIAFFSSFFFSFSYYFFLFLLFFFFFFPFFSFFLSLSFFFYPTQRSTRKSGLRLSNFFFFFLFFFSFSFSLSLFLSFSLSLCLSVFRSVSLSLCLCVSLSLSHSLSFVLLSSFLTALRRPQPPAVTRLELSRTKIKRMAAKASQGVSGGHLHHHATMSARTFRHAPHPETAVSSGDANAEDPAAMRR